MLIATANCGHTEQGIGMNSILRKYRDFLPLNEPTDSDSLGEGNTPLVKSIVIAKSLGLNLFFKSEHLNPSGSFKDRFAAVEVALMRQARIKACFATSSGNTGSALAAYTARQGIQCHIFINEITPASKLSQMMIYGAKLFRVRGFGLAEETSRNIFQRLQELAEECSARFIVSAYEYSPDGMEGVKTIAYELVEQLGQVPDQIFVPVGGGGMLTAIWRGFIDLKERSLISTMPRMIAVQPELNDTIITAILTGKDKAQGVKTLTNINGLAVQVDLDATRALTSVRESGGEGVLVSDYQIIEAQKQLCREGQYVEAAGAVSVAGCLKAATQNGIRSSEKVVCILSGHGFKDPASAGFMALQTEVKEIDLNALRVNLIKCA